jgi:5'-3' exonuclease
LDQPCAESEGCDGDETQYNQTWAMLEASSDYYRGLVCDGCEGRVVGGIGVKTSLSLLARAEVKASGWPPALGRWGR